MYHLESLYWRRVREAVPYERKLVSGFSIGVCGVEGWLVRVLKNKAILNQFVHWLRMAAL